ncbi:MAG TPA: haloacid dehalogenase-like hydrolase [Armatimonadota bacterium]|jgi:2-hydroxy-3-keto-5-methylthiopentenyl-1-phosphate phosphatase
MSADTQRISATPILISDFDGTMTRYDFYQLAAESLVPSETPDYWGDYLAGRLTHFEALRRIFATIRADEADVLATARRMELDPALAPAVARLEHAGWEIAVASAGCAWYIRYLLDAAQARITVHANPGQYVPGYGLVMELPTDSPYYAEATGISKDAVVRDALATHRLVAFAGDGRPDLAAALLVDPPYRFARGWLAEHLREQDIPFQAFNNWAEIADKLAPVS